MRGAATLHSLDASGDTLSARLTLPDAEYPLRFRVPAGIERLGYEPFLVAALPMAMRFARSLEVPEPVSPRLLAAIPKAQRLLADWTPVLEPVALEADAAAVPPGAAPEGVAAFFTGGSDSLYTALRNRERIRALVHVHGYEVRVDSPERRRILVRKLHEFAD